MASTSVLRLILPGELVLEYDPDKEEKPVFLGPGLRWHKNRIYATKPGILKRDGKSLFYVDAQQKCYVPHRREFVIGTVVKKKGDNYMIDIGSHELATISYLAFENASKKTRKELKSGDLIYGQLLVANKDMEPELVCIDVYDRAVGMGSLPEGGLLFSVPLHVARSIISPENPYLLSLSKRIAYSIVIGFNGKVWLKATKQTEMVALMHAISILEHISIDEALKNIDAFIDSFLFKR